MDAEVERAIEEARAVRAAGDAAGAERGYARAAAMARSQGDAPALAHALRHVSDLARERGAAEEARAAAAEAAAIYRALPDRRPLDLANALRLEALALEAGGTGAAARELWEEARAFYAAAQVQVAVEECERRLGG
jgi:hypothetical protein